MSEPRNSLLSALHVADLRTKQGRAASAYMDHKGYRGIRPVGCIPVDDGCSYFYYDLPEGLLELEVAKTTGGSFRAVVTAFVINRQEVRELLVA